MTTKDFKFDPKMIEASEHSTVVSKFYCLILCALIVLMVYN